MSRDVSNKSKISDIIALLEKLKAEHGDINVCTSTEWEYWGDVENYATENNVQVKQHAQPQGPKSGKSEKAVVFSY
jgi:hypothetical protein